MFTADYQSTQLRDLNSVADITQQCERILIDANTKKQLLEQDGSFPTQVRFYQPIDSLIVSLGNLSGRLRLISDSFNEPSIKNAARVCIKKIANFESELWLSQPIHEKYLNISQGDLDDETKYSIQKYLIQFQKKGVSKDAQTRAKLHQLNSELTNIGQQFNKNINESVRYIKVKPEELKGLPAEYINARSLDENGFIEISTRYPDIIPVISYAENDEVKKRLWFAFWQRAYPENVPVVEQLLQKRFEYAQLLGFDNYAHYIISDKMAKTPQRVKDFLTQLNEYTKAADQKDYNRLLARLQQIYPKTDKVELWQRDYVYELVLKEQLQVDSKAIGRYFSFDKTKAGILELTQELFGIQVKPWDTWLWDTSVTAYEVYDNGKLLGRFYLDLHPRDGKFTHAKVVTLQKGIEGKQIPVAAVLANFPKGNAAMSHREVTTFLHEFGHALHVMFASTQWSNTAGVSTERDFIEAPSQMLEEWAWHYPTLSRFATNSASEVLPKEMFDAMYAARDFNLGMNTRQQLHYGAFSLDVYNRDPNGLDVDKLSDDLQSIYTLFPANDDQYLYTSFTHLNGYSASYYTYQWSQAIAMDILSKFKENGMMDKETASRYRQLILEQGGSKPADILLEDFLQRPVSFDAFAGKLKTYSQQ
ncbi:Zn-dependent oligopeptidase [Pseudoalteromonas sp. JBTF-M23]|uniref:Zn-dependent oligopeptidase n=1 Tax=Pseudoalteromonas caenipelagi TaxID=2726988 RepID=A0A849VIF5_9GAMM|nr:Zn-dependent oligopeptidase [Pseudoalteromonas caenipelagi]